MHIPIDENVLLHLQRPDPSFPKVLWLKDLTKEKYLAIQQAARKLAQLHEVPPIWYEAAWTG